MTTNECYNIVQAIRKKSSKPQNRALWFLICIEMLLGFSSVLLLYAIIFGLEIPSPCPSLTIGDIWWGGVMMFILMFISTDIIMRAKFKEDEKFDRLNRMIEGGMEYEEAMKQLELSPKQKSNEC
jgi:hypothetical protein